MALRTHSHACEPEAPVFRESLARAQAGVATLVDGYILIRCSDEQLDELCAAAAAVRDASKGRIVTYSRKVFLPITNLCRDRCSYCTFRKDPDDPGAWTMSRDEIDEWLQRGRAQG